MFHRLVRVTTENFSVKRKSSKVDVVDSSRITVVVSVVVVVGDCSCGGGSGCNDGCSGGYGGGGCDDGCGDYCGGI